MAATRIRKKTNAMICLRDLFVVSCFLTLSLPYVYCEESSPSSCIFDGFDFALIKKFNPWVMVSEDGNTTYRISLCEPLKPTHDENTDCHGQTGVCRKPVGEPPRSSGNYTNVAAANNTHSSEKTLLLQGDVCPEGHNQLYVTLITFQCSLDAGLGSPEFLTYSQCTTFVMWRTNVMCTGVERAVKEVPCYVYDQHNRKHNLAPLTQKDGGYLVSSEEGWNFYINVCKDIKGATAIPGGETDSKTLKCPPGSGACQVDKNGVAVGMGDPEEKLMVAADENKFLLHYNTAHDNTAQIVDGCTALPTTTIEFRCPKEGGGKEPVLLPHFNCQFHIEWETEHACVETDITSKTCHLTKESDNIDIDLTPLQKMPAARKYQVTVTPSNKGGDTYIYYLNVCGEVGIQCPDQDHVDNVAVCQTKVGDGSFGKILGSTRDNDQILRYADGELTLTYKGGDICHKNNPRTTVINFRCDPKAKFNGQGYPTFLKEVNDSCIYMFDWPTKYACSGHPANEECRVNYKGKRYDLSPLIRQHGNETNWEVLHSDRSDSGKKFFINVCNDLLAKGEAGRCHPDASVCLIDKDGPHNLGSYEHNPVYSKETGTVQITYTDGDNCGGGKQTQSVIDFVCKPGDLVSGPVLLDTSLDKCLYRFEWHTSAACVLGHWRGDNCHVEDKEAGFNFDLSPLTLKTGSYDVWDKNRTYEYNINVCAAVKGTQCDSVSPPNAAVCQTKGGSQAINVGSASSSLAYYDGMINLTYTGGHMYNSKPPVPRKTEIAFLCDHDAGKGKPSFLEESAWGYSFEWYTVYACPNEPVECTVFDEDRHQQYDLSSLSKSETGDNWSIRDSRDSNGEVKYYINVCRSLNEVNVGTGCSIFAGACRTSFKTGTETVDIADLGKVVSPPKVEREGQVSLKYRSRNQTCDSFNGKTYYTTSIHFICSRGTLVSGPSTVQQLGNCDFVFMWPTEAACPIETTKANSNCSIKDRNSDYVFNLNLLKRKGDNDYYDVVDGSNHFRINICGSMSQDHCGLLEGKASSLCRLYPNQTMEALTSLEYSLDYDDDGKLMLKYEGKRLDNGRRIEVRVLFLCRRNVDIGEPKFDRIDEEYKYIFMFETSLACKPDPLDCVADDSNGNHYDLSPLARGSSDTSWQVLDSRDNHKDLTYHINVCRPINSAGTSCPGGPIGGCQVTNTGGSFNIGYIYSQPIAATDGTVTLHYRNGDICHKNTSKESYRSTRIIFSCSGIEHNPTFMGETDSCEYMFAWQTPHACPQKKPQIGHNCRVTDPLNMYEFDLNPLRKDTDYSVSTSDSVYVYKINVCGPLQSTNCEDASAAVCQTKAGDAHYHVNAGTATSDLWYQSGEITLRYTDGLANCHGKYNRSTIITFLCDHATDGSQGPVFIITEADDCTYMFEWRTKLACPPFKVGGCSITDKNGNQYDLSRLALTSNNYDYIDYVNRKKYIINVCRSLVHKKGEELGNVLDQTCPYNAAACMVDLAEMNNTKRFHNIGEVNEHQVIVDNGQLELVYTNGEVCSTGARMSTRIIMYCDADTLYSHPAGHFTVNNCEHDFTWSTSAACPINSQTKGGNCTVKNPATGHVFDLTSLKKDTPYKVNDSRGHTFELNVCGKVLGSQCTENSVGVCQEEQTGPKRKYNSGDFNSNLQFDEGVLVLNYNGGTDCHQHQFKRSTIINFVCSKSAGTGYPVFIDETDDCTYYFSWHTSLACEEEVKCSVDNGTSTIDLSPLVKNTGQYMALSTTSGKNVSYYINICRPLNPIYGTLCPPQSSSCMLQKDGKPQSLGKLVGPPQLENGKVTLVYTGGDKCLSDNSKNMSTKLIFVCNPGRSQSESAPVLQEVSNCQYIFVWDTSVVCDKDDSSLQPVGSKDCFYKDSQTGNTFDLSSFKEAPQPDPITKNGFTYLVNICEPVETTLPGCKNAGVCRTNQTSGFSFGSVANQKISKTGKVIQLTYTHGDKCDGGRNSESIVTFDCDTSGVVGQPKYSYAGRCQAMFYWKTCVICPTVADACSLGYKYHSYDLSMLSSETGGWNLKDTKGNMYWINICQSVANGPVSNEPCGHMVAAWRQTPSGQVDRLGLISTQTLKMDPDEKTIVLRYTQGDPACSHAKRRSDNTAAQTVIRFECGNTVGGPRFIESQIVKEKDGKVTDPESGTVIDLSKIPPYDIKTGDGSKYHIDLAGISGNSDCPDSVVCLTDKTSSSKNIGSFSKRKFYFEDGILEAEYESDQICFTDRKKNAKTIITFHCNEEQSPPMLLSRSKNCVHMFLLETQLTCLHPDVEIPQPTDTISAAKTALAVKGKTVVTVVCVFLAAIVVCVLLIVFHKKERRDACIGRIRSAVKKDQQYRYSMLPDSLVEDDDEDILEAANNAESESIIPREVNAVSVDSELNVESYHDDSDIDLLE